ncbi:unnamed protein product [Protopolystoma xenopodis]|uniref:Uncharacterized protein n=1 Tax=Protopolystoma xenopodis TaxID=117903 RepID=A0A448WWK7_9PLAT|nr:unnamed protein product [Protopolystoma xenopodis]
MFSQDSLDPSSLAPWSTDLKVHICRASRGAINQPKRSQRDKPHANRFNLTDFIVLKAWPLCREPLREGRPIKSTISPIITPFTPSSSPCRQLLMRVVSMDTLGPWNAYNDVNIGCVEGPETRNTKICMLEAFRAHWNCGLSEWWNYLEERFDINRSCRCTTQEIDLKILETTNSLLDRLTLRMVSSSSSSACSSSGGHLLLQAV